ncbi:MAG: BamA/TamA family outer membrane protein [Pseudomonadota bacterium]
MESAQRSIGCTGNPNSQLGADTGDRALRRMIASGALALTVLMPMGPAHAITETVITVVNQPEEVQKDLVEALESVSVTLKAIEEERDNISDQIAAAQSEYRAMISVLYGQGYFGPDVSVKVDGREVAGLDPLNLPAAINRVDISVDPGPKFTFGLASVAPRAPAAAASGELVNPDFVRGAPAQSAIVGAAVSSTLREWREEGYAKADVVSEDITANHRTAELDVDIRVNEGRRLRFGELTIEGDTDVSIKRIREMVGFPTGEVYDPELIRKSTNRLRRGVAFETVVLEEADTPNPDDTLDFRLTVIDNPKRRFGVSAEYSTLDGILLGGFWLHRNVFGGAESFRVDAEISNIGGSAGGFDPNLNGSGIDYTTTFRLARPAAFGPDNVAFLQGEFEHEDEPDYTETSALVSIGITRFITDRLFAEGSLGYRYSSAEDAFGDREFNHIVVPLKLEANYRDNDGDPLSGFFVRANVQPMAGVNGSENLVVTELDNRAYLSFGEKAPVTLAGRVQIGSASGASLEETPPDFLFFSGGGDTVRGQSYQSLSATEENGQGVGGRSFLGVQAELRMRFTESLGMALFADYGTVGTGSWIEPGDPEHSGVGLGVRYNTPIGPLRVDLATPYTGPEDEFSSVSLYIGVGQAF